MRPFIQWLDEKGFTVRQHWDIKNNRWGGVGRLQLFPHQRRILEHVFTPDPVTGLLPYTTVLYSTVKKSGKSALAAAVGAWGAEELGEVGSEIYVAANDLEQAEGRIMRDIKFHYENHEIDYGAYVTTYRIVMPNQTIIQALAQSYKSVAGSRHKVTLWDEIWGITTETSRRNWEELTPIPTEPNSVRFIATYAGFENESDLLWELYTSGVGKEEHKDGLGEKIPGLEDLPCWRNGNLFVYWNHDPRMPWQTDEYYEGQRTTMRPASYLRIHENQWVSTHESFIPIQWYDDGIDKTLKNSFIVPGGRYDEYPMYLALDASFKKDSTALVGVCYDREIQKIVQMGHRIWVPREDERFDLTDIEKYIEHVYNKFRVVGIWYDPTQLHQMMTNLYNKGIRTEEFPQTVGNMTKASQNIYDLFKSQSYVSYYDEEFRRHLQMTVAETKGQGFRIVKTKTSERHKIDGAVALAIAAYQAILGGGVDTSEAIDIRAPFSDFTEYTAKDDPSQKVLPFELRS